MAVRNILLKELPEYSSVLKHLRDLGFEFKASKEILACHDVMTIWADKFNHLGKLVSLEHRSQPDDPPDVRAKFDSGYILDLEHTSVDSWQRHLAHKLTGCQGGVIPPESANYKTKNKIKEAANSGIYGPWTRVEAEVQTACERIFDAMKKKIKSYPKGGGSWYWRAAAIIRMISTFRKLSKALAQTSAGLAGAEKWTYSFISRGNFTDYYLAFFMAPDNFEKRSKSLSKHFHKTNALG